MQIFQEWNSTCTVKREGEESGSDLPGAAEVALSIERSTGTVAVNIRSSFTHHFQAKGGGFKYYLHLV